MGWIGKIIGGTIGLSLGGPLGAILGTAIGHRFDKSDEKYLEGFGGTNSGSFDYNPQTREMTFFVAVFSMLAKIAKADGRISSEEISEVELFMEKDLHLDDNGKKAAINIFRAAKDSSEPFESFARQFYEAFANQRQILELMIDVLVRVGASDGMLVTEEDILIHSAARMFGFSDGEYDNIKARHNVSATDHYYAVLKCNASDDISTIKKQYRKLVSEYHPDKIMGKGLPDEFVVLANEKFREIQEAYEAVSKQRGF